MHGANRLILVGIRHEDSRQTGEYLAVFYVVTNHRYEEVHFYCIYIQYLAYPGCSIACILHLHTVFSV
jgi:hypothetical protein